MTPVDRSRPALFCDRDGNLIVEKEFISDPAAVELIPGVAEALKRAQAAGYLLFVVTNQSGIARGLMSDEDVALVNQRLSELLANKGVKLDGIFYCPHHPDLTGACDCRKPARGMIDQACSRYAIDLSRSFVTGDRVLDMELARNIEAGGIMVKTGYGEIESAQLPLHLKSIRVVSDFAEAVDVILKENNNG
jgi:histidinol-phosphate phosphatase family protein